MAPERSVVRYWGVNHVFQLLFLKFYMQDNTLKLHQDWTYPTCLTWCVGMAQVRVLRRVCA